MTNPTNIDTYLHMAVTSHPEAWGILSQQRLQLVATLRDHLDSELEPYPAQIPKASATTSPVATFDPNNLGKEIDDLNTGTSITDVLRELAAEARAGAEEWADREGGGDLEKAVQLRDGTLIVPTEPDKTTYCPVCANHATKSLTYIEDTQPKKWRLIDLYQAQVTEQLAPLEARVKNLEATVRALGGML